MNCWKQLTAAAALLVCCAAPAAADIIDPAGDTFNAFGASHDIIGTTAAVNGANLDLSVTFAGPIDAPSATSPNSIMGYIDFDTDQNPTTLGSLPAVINFFGFPGPVPGPLVNMDADFYIDLSTEVFNAGFVDVIDALTLIGFPVPIVFTPNGFSLSIPLALLGGDDGLLNYSVLIGNAGPLGGGGGEFTDRAPNGVDPGVSAVPEPSSLLTFAAVFSAAGAYFARSRRRRT
jgi:hypothetical protein